MDTNDHHFHCDINTGLCSSVPKEKIADLSTFKTTDKVKIIYFTDPICSACWAIEPQLRKLKFEYSPYFSIEYRMGGLLPSWEVLAEKGGSISSPSDVAPHWEYMGKVSGMSMDGDLWLNDPLSSSHPPSIAFKAAAMQGEEAGLLFMRKMRELLFLEGKNIEKDEVLLTAAKNAGLDTKKWETDYKGTTTNTQFEADLSAAKTMGVRGFPSFYFIDQNGKHKLLYGLQSYEKFENLLKSCLSPSVSIVKNNFKGEIIDLFNAYSLLNITELEALTNLSSKAIESYLENLVAKKSLLRKRYKFGDFYALNGED